MAADALRPEGTAGGEASGGISELSNPLADHGSPGKRRSRRIPASRRTQYYLSAFYGLSTVLSHTIPLLKEGGGRNRVQ
jgi:hypothetical protein